MEKHPDLFEEAKAFEKSEDNTTVGEKFYWMGQGQPLSTLEVPAEKIRIIEHHEKKVARFKSKKRRNALLDNDDGVCEFTDLDFRLILDLFFILNFFLILDLFFILDFIYMFFYTYAVTFVNIQFFNLDYKLNSILNYTFLFALILSLFISFLSFVKTAPGSAS